MLVMVAKSTAVAFMMHAENGCFQDLKTSWWRSGKKGSGLWGWAGARLVRKRSSSLDWDPPPNPAPVYSPREWPRPTARCRTASCVSPVRQEGEIRMCRPVSPPTPRPRWTKHRHHTAHSQRRLHRRPPGWAVDPRRRKQRAQRGFRLLLTLDWGRASEWRKLQRITVLRSGSHTLPQAIASCSTSATAEATQQGLDTGATL